MGQKRTYHDAAIDTLLAAKASDASLTAHLNDTVDAHDASAISFVPTGTVASTDVQAAIAEVASEGGGAGGVLATDLANTSNVALGDALVGVKQSGTGGVGRTLHDKIAESISAIDYGADPTGVANSAAAINNALAAGNSVTLPLGTYLLETAVSIPQGKRLIGQSKSGTILKRKTTLTANYCVRFPAPDATVQNLTIDGSFNSSTFSGIGGYAEVEISPGGNRSTVREVRIINPAGKVGIELSGPNAKVLNCYFQGNNEGTTGTTTHNTYGIWASWSASTNYLIHGSEFRDFNWNAILCGGSGTISNNLFANNHNSIAAPTGGGAQVSTEGTDQNLDIRIVNNRFEPSGNGVNGHVHGMEFYNGQQSILVQGNTIYQQSNAGVSVGVNTRNIKIVDNTISNCGQRVTSSSRYGIHIAAGADNVEVSRNHCFDDQATPTQQYGIRVDTGVTGKYSIHDNYLYGNAVDGLLDSSATQTLAAGTAISPKSAIVPITAASVITSTAAPTIANGVDGQAVTIINVGANSITLSDQGTLANSNLRLTTTTYALGQRDSIKLMYSSTLGDWIELHRSNVL